MIKTLRLSFWCGLIFLLVAADGGPARAFGTDVPITQFNNPILENLADPMMFRDVNTTSGAVTYYLAGTSFDRYKSRDMVHWERLSNWSNVNQAKNWPGSNNQAISGIWACEVIKKGTTYFLFFSAIRPSGDKRVVYVATSSNVEGTFTIQSTPVVELSTNNAIDPSPFLDPISGKYFLYYSQDQATDPQHIARVFAIELSDDLLSQRAGTSASLCVEAETQNWESQWQEGACVREHNGTYYLFYSSRCYCSDSYAVGYATSSSPKGGTWTKYAGNPILQKSNSAMGKISGPGHINIVKAPDGIEDWMVYHAHSSTSGGGQRHTAMDRYHFQTATGGKPDIVVVDGPTLAKQALPAGAPALPAVGPLENFNTSTLDRNRWSKIREENSANYDLTDSALLIRPQSGALFTAGVDDLAGNIFLQNAPTSGNWFADTTLLFSGISTSRKGDVFGGIVAWQDARHYVAARADANGRLWVETCNQTQGNAEVLTTNDLGTPVLNPAYLRLFFDEGHQQFLFYASSNRVDYTLVTNVANPLSDQRFTLVGPMAYSRAQTSTVSGAEVRFDWFGLTEDVQEYRWPLDTNATDVLGGLTGSPENTPQFAAGHVEGIGSLYLDGNSSIQLDPNSILQDETFACTVSFWFKPARLQGMQVLYEEGGAQNGIAVRLNGSTLQAGVAASSVLTTVSLTGIASNVWQFVTVTFYGRKGNPGVLALYCNGQSNINSNAPASIPTHINNSGFGAVNSNYAFADGGGRFQGWLDDVRLTKGAAVPPNLIDTDGDGLTDSQELALGTNPAKWDTDGDGVSDGFEVLRAGTNPNSAQDAFNVRLTQNPPGFVIPATSVFSFVFEQLNPDNGQWTFKAGPFTTAGIPKVITLDQLGFSASEQSVLLRVKVNE